MPFPRGWSLNRGSTVVEKKNVKSFNLSVADQYRGFESEKPTPDCTETDSCHGDHMDPGICVGFLSNSIFGISIHHNQQLSRLVESQKAFHVKNYLQAPLHYNTVDIL